MSAGVDVDHWLEEGRRAHAAGDAAKAKDCYERALAADPKHYGALCLLADLALRAQAWREAAVLLQRALEVSDGAALLHVALGQALQHLGRDAEAMDRFGRASRLDPDCAEAQVALAALHGAAGRLGERDDCLRQWLAIKIRRGERPEPSTSPPVRIADTTLVCVDCRYYELAAEALSRTLQRCRFDRALFLTDGEVEVRGVETVAIAPISSAGQYSRFMIKELDRYVDTGFALIVQYDGFVLNGACWSEQFLEYDYVGAPWAGADGMTVGNGGFSLRSKKLLRASQDPQIEQLHPEDIALCRTYRPLLEGRHGVRFAPAEVARRFSFESLPAAEPTFGFHGIDHLFYLFGMTDAEIAGYRPPR
jgi:hypothetical protein